MATAADARRSGKVLLRSYDTDNIYIKNVAFSYDNALAESIIGLFKTKVIKFLGPWKSVGQVEWETLKWVDWYNKTRLHSAIGYVTPNEAEEVFYASLNAAEKAA